MPYKCANNECPNPACHTRGMSQLAPSQYKSLPVTVNTVNTMIGGQQNFNTQLSVVNTLSEVNTANF